MEAFEISTVEDAKLYANILKSGDPIMFVLSTGGRELDVFICPEYKGFGVPEFGKRAPEGKYIVGVSTCYNYFDVANEKIDLDDLCTKLLLQEPAGRAMTDMLNAIGEELRKLGPRHESILDLLN